MHCEPFVSLGSILVDLLRMTSSAIDYPAPRDSLQDIPPFLVQPGIV